MRIKEVMSQPVVTCPIDATLDHAARLMWEFDCGIVPLVNADGRLAGVVTDRDICMAGYTQGLALRQIPVSTAMASRVVAAHIDDGVESVEALMRDHKVRRIPILDAEGRPVGIASVNDFARLAARVHKSAIDRDLVNTLAAVCQPRPSPPGRVLLAG